SPAPRQIADVDKLPPAVAGRVLPPASHIQTPPGADSGPGVGYDDAIRSVGQERNLGKRCVSPSHKTRSEGWVDRASRFVTFAGHPTSPFCEQTIVQVVLGTDGRRRGRSPARAKRTTATVLAIEPRARPLELHRRSRPTLVIPGPALPKT